MIDIFTHKDIDISMLELNQYKDPYFEQLPFIAKANLYEWANAFKDYDKLPPASKDSTYVISEMYKLKLFFTECKRTRNLIFIGYSYIGGLMNFLPAKGKTAEDYHNVIVKNGAIYTLYRGIWNIFVYNKKEKCYSLYKSIENQYI
jgi:hypothetical protein